MPVEWDVNYIAVVVAAIVNMVIGTVYYLPQVAGKAWMNAIDKTAEDLRGANQPILYVLAAIFSLLLATVMAAAIGWANAHTLGEGALVGLLFWIGLAMPIVGMTFMFEGRRFASHAITGGHYLIALVVMGAIIGWWPWGDSLGSLRKA